MSKNSKPKLKEGWREVLVEDIMNRHVVTIPDSTSIDEAIRVMKKNSVGCVVIKKGPKLLGIITERDIIRILAEGRMDARTVGGIASKPLIVIGPKDPVKKATRILADKGIRRLPVVEDTRLVGIVTSTDLVKFYDKLSKYIIKGVGP
jgi:CBS domain-containing protein